MAKFKERPTDAPPGEPEQWPEPGGDLELAKLRRLAESSNQPLPDWLGDKGPKSDLDCVHLLEMVYALGDLQVKAKDMRLEFLGYLLGMALQETLAQMRGREPGHHPSPSAR